MGKILKYYYRHYPDNCSEEKVKKLDGKMKSKL